MSKRGATLLQILHLHGWIMKKLTFQILIALLAISSRVEASAEPSAPYSRLLRAFISDADAPKWRADYAIALNGFCSHIVSKVADSGASRPPIPG